MTVKVDNGPQHVAVPPAAAETMRLKTACSTCECRYAVIGAAFLHDGRVEMDSNFVENRIRPIKLTAKNALFAGHDEGARMGPHRQPDRDLQDERRRRTAPALDLVPAGRDRQRMNGNRLMLTPSNARHRTVTKPRPRIGVDHVLIGRFLARTRNHRDRHLIEVPV